MARLILWRLTLGVVTLFAVALIVFGGTELLPGDVAQAILGQAATPESLAALRSQLGVDRPLLERLADYFGGLVQFDLGQSLSTGRPVVALLAENLPRTLVLGLCAAAVAVPLALVLGLVSATRPGSMRDRAISGVALVTISAPEFLVATLLVLVFAVNLGWFPAIARLPRDGDLAAIAMALTLPIVTLVAMVLAPMTRMTRSAVLQVLTQPAIEMAILKGLSLRRIIVRHALPNAVAPIANVIALNLAYMISGVVVVEVIFSYPGMGKLMVDAVASRDIPLVQGCALVFCGIYVLVNLMADLVAILANPRMRRPR